MKALIQLLAVAMITLLWVQGVIAQNSSARMAPSPDEDGVIGAHNNRNFGSEKESPAIRMLLMRSIDVVNRNIDLTAFQAALSELLELQRRPNLAPFEKAVLVQLTGYVYAQMGKTDLAIEAYEEILADEELPHPMHQGALYTLAHLYTEKQEFDKTIELMLEWFQYEQEPIAESYMLLGSSLASLARYEEALPWTERAIEKSVRPFQAWYEITYSIYVELEQYDKAIAMLKVMLEHWTRNSEYWEALAGLYQQTGDERAAFDTTMAAYINGMLTNAPDILMLVDMSYYYETPFVAGSILENEMIAGVIPENLDTLNSLIDIWIAAREYGRAVAMIDKIVAYTDGGPYYMRAARLNIQSGNWTGAATSVEKALAAGVDDPVLALVVLGTSYSELDEYEKSIAAFRRVAETGDEEERRNAENWIEFVEETRAYRSVISSTQ